MTTLQQKLDQLSLTTMSHQLDQTITDAVAKNLSLAQALESLVDSELEARNSRSIERHIHQTNDLGLTQMPRCRGLNLRAR